MSAYAKTTLKSALLQTRRHQCGFSVSFRGWPCNPKQMTNCKDPVRKPAARHTPPKLFKVLHRRSFMPTLSSDKLISVVVVAACAGILLAQCIRTSFAAKEGKKAPIAIFVQFMLVFTRNITILLQMTVPSVNCAVLAKMGYLVYFLWVVALDYVLLIRSMAFSSHPKYLAIAVTCLWVAFASVHGYMIYEIKAVSAPGDYCDFVTNFGASTYTLAIRAVLEVLLLIPFILSAIKSYKLMNGVDRENGQMWLRMSVTNSIATAGIILVELAASAFSQNPSLVPYLLPIFTVVNFVEANLVLFVIEDTKKELTRSKHSGSKSKTQAESRANISVFGASA
ncbi:hypothetical protein EDD86DRAFT_255810 [Gorgonomyces haynaldii]|nr:hypothetical protein EDD86DRAFT_255810 [Gorgonomyces haynaldii]